MNIQPNYTAAPDGRSRATLISGDSDPLGLWQAFNIPTAGLYSFSVFVKPSQGARDLILKMGDQEVIFNNGAGIALPNGWYECKISAPLSQGTISCHIILGAGSGSLLIFGSSFYSGTAGAYIPTGTTTDYSIQQPDTVVFSTAPNPDDVLLWTGSYRYNPSLIQQTIMSQYANSPKLMHIIQTLFDAVDMTKFTADYQRLIMSIPTANGYGLDIWGIIVGVSRTVNLSDPDEGYFGFEDGFYPFNERPFSSAGGASTSWELPDEIFREFILLKAMGNIIYATAPNINKLLNFAFDGPASYLLTGHMQATYVFEFPLTTFQNFIVYNTTLLPRPCGVEVLVVEL